MEHPYQSIFDRLDALNLKIDSAIKQNLNEHGFNKFMYQRLPEAAQTLGVKESTLRSYVRKRKIKYHKVGSIIYFSFDHLNEFVEQGRILNNQKSK